MKNGKIELKDLKNRITNKKQKQTQKEKYQISLYLEIENYNKLWKIITSEKSKGNRGYSATQFINDVLNNY